MSALIQATEGQLTSGGALTLTWPSGAPTDGNLLVGVFASANNPSTRLTPTGWTKITTTEFHSDTGVPTQPRGDMYYRIASSEGTTVDWNTSEAGDRSKLAWMAEFDGIPGSPAAPDHAILSGDGTNVSTRSTGTASTSKSDYLAIAAWVWVNATTVTFTSATNSISLEAEEFINAANDKGIIVGYNLTGALESTLTFGGPSDSDIAGAIAVFEINAAADTTAPVITITQPSASDVVGGTVEVRATFSDAVTAAADAANMEVSINSGAGAAMTWDAGGYWKYSWDTTGVADGATTIDVSGDDEAANTGNATQVSVTVDNTAPTIAITLPAGAATVSSTQEVRATFTDTNTTAANAASMEVSINGGAGAAMTWDAGNGWWDYQWDTTGTAEGAATVDVSGDDVVDLGTANTGNASQVAVTVDNVPDASPGTKKFKQLPQYGSIMFNGA